MTTHDWIQKFEEYLFLVKNRSVNTVRGYIADAELLERFCAGKIDGWADFTEDMAVEYVREVKKKASEATVQRKVLSLRQFFKFLLKKGAVTMNPLADMETRAVRRRLPTVLSIEEMNRLLNCVRQPIAALSGIPNEETFLTVRDRALLETLYSAGLRVSELCGMDWENIDWNKREVRVIGKGNKQRVCPLGQKALEALMDYARHYEEHWKRKPEGPAPVFLSEWNRRINTRTIPRTIHKWCHLAGVRRVHPHAFRHSCATHMLEGGADIRVVQVLLGHAHLTTTEIYTHVGTRKLKSVFANTHPRA
jgi:integrase/recombinase XerC